MTDVIQPLFTAEEFFRASHRFQQESETNRQQEHAKPRASGLLDCARDQMYTMAGETPSNPEADTDHRDQAFSNEDNRRTEDLTIDVIRLMAKGFSVTDRQISVGEDSLYTGHPDGRFYDAYTGSGETTTLMKDGLVWGFEHKKLGRYSYLKTFKEGLLSAKPGYIVQAIAYGKALGWDVVQFVILAEDASSMRGEATNARRAKSYSGVFERPDWNPKVLLPVVDLRPLYALYPSIEARAQALIDARAEGLTGDDIKPEYDGQANFPCGSYCEFRDRCRSVSREETLRVIPRTIFNAA